MQKLLALVVAVFTCAARAEHGPSEPILTHKNKSHLLEVLGEALRNKDINHQQYEQSVAWVNATPCNGVDRRLTNRLRHQLELAIATEQHRPQVKVFDVFRINRWFIVFSDASDGDEPYLFYSEDPRKGSHPITAWGGAATIFETSEVAKWAEQNAPGIPSKLANCFAWHVTLSPE